MFNPTAELVIPKEIPSKEAKAQMETQPVTVEITVFNIIPNSTKFFSLLTH